MNHRHLQQNRELRDRLAAEYVLGTLRSGARQRFESWLALDDELAHAVHQWQQRLNPMAEFAPAVQPPVKVWNNIAQTLGLNGSTLSADPSFPQRLVNRLGDSLGFWRGLGIGATALAALLVVVIAVRDIRDSALPMLYVATLSNEAAAPAFIITGDVNKKTMTVKAVALQTVGTNNSLELWAVPKTGAPQPLGLLASNGVVTLQLPANVTPESTAALAISLEPMGGSPNRNAPSGPILYKGAWLQI